MGPQDYYKLGLTLRQSIDPLLPEDMRVAPQQSQGQQPGMPPPHGAPPAQSPDGGQPAAMSMGDFQYDTRVTDALIKQYMDAGYDPRFAVGMAANSVVESSLNPTAMNDSEGAFGLFQWRNDRLNNLKEFADRRGKSINDINTQVAFSVSEFGLSEKSAYEKIIGAKPQSAAEYAKLIDQHYERSSGEARKRRAAIAAQMYQDYFGQDGRYRDGAPTLNFSQQYAPVQPNAMSRQDIAFAEQAKRSGMDMSWLNSSQPSQPDQGTQGFNPADFTITPSAVDQNGVPTPPQTTQTTQGQQPPQTDTGYSPTGGQPSTGQNPIGTSAQAGGTGSMREGIGGGLQDIFGRQQGESDASFRDRRRNMFLNAAEGFQMLSRGTKADFVTPTQQRLNEKQRRIDNRYRDTEQVRTQGNADRNFQLATAQEQRLQRAQGLAEQQFIMEQAANAADKQNDMQMRQNMAEFYQGKGMEDLSTMTMNGNAKLAGEIYQDRVAPGGGKTGLDTFTLSEDAAQAAIDRANAAGRKDIAEAIRTRKENPRAAAEAHKQLLGMELNATPDGEFNQQVYDSMVASIPDNLPPQEKKRLTNMADAAVRQGSDGAANSWFNSLDKSVERGSSISATQDAVYKAYNDRFAQVFAPATALADAGLQNMAVAANPKFQPNQLKGSVLNPIARFMRSVPGGEELSKSLLGVTDADVFSNKILTAIKNGQLGNLAQGVTGQLSNLEGDRLLSRLGDGTMERVEIMALGQLLVRERKAEIAKQSALYDYKQEVHDDPSKTFNLIDLETRMHDAAKSVELFDKVKGDSGRVALRNKLISEWAANNGYTTEDVQNMDHTELPSELKGQVVFDTEKNDYVPLFKEAFPEYQKP